MKPHSSPSRSPSGAALLAVLWVIALLLGLVAGASLLLTQDLDAAVAKRQIFRARMLAEAALAIAMNPDVKPDDGLLRHQVAEDERYEVEISSEDGLLNPNFMILGNDRLGLRRIFTTWGIKLQDADAIIDDLVDWVDANDFSTNNKGAEKKTYGNDGRPFNRPFRSVDEMSMVRGMALVEQAYPDWRRWFSIHATGLLDLSYARPEIISAFTGADIRLANQLRGFRLGRDGILNTEDDGSFVDLGEALNRLGLSANSPEAAKLTVSGTGGTAGSINIKRIIVRVRVGDFDREVVAVVRGGKDILEMSEGNPTEQR